MNNDICRFCKSKNSWDCEDGYLSPYNCNSFYLDWESLSDKHKKMFMKIIDMILDEELT